MTDKFIDICYYLYRIILFIGFVISVVNLLIYYKYEKNTHEMIYWGFFAIIFLIQKRLDDLV
jgi:uncharacterized membrane protein